MRADRRRFVAWIGIIATALAMLVVATVDGQGVESDVERVQRLNATFACPTCDGESVADSSAAVSATIRQYVTEQVAAGKTDQEIRDALILAYDAQILLTPRADGFAALIWILPVVVTTLAAMLAGLALTRNQGQDLAPTDSDLELVELARRQLAEAHDDF